MLTDTLVENYTLVQPDGYDTKVWVRLENRCGDFLTVQHPTNGGRNTRYYKLYHNEGFTCDSLVTILCGYVCNHPSLLHCKQASYIAHNLTIDSNLSPTTHLWLLKFTHIALGKAYY